MENEIAVRQDDMSAPLTALAIRAQVQLIQEVMREVMQGPSKENPNGVHYGLIPGCGDKPSLFKPGAEKLFLTFRLRPIIDPALDVVITELANGHRDYRVHCHILNMQGMEMATGVGSASTLESKHRYRGGEKKSTGKTVPTEYWNLKKAGKEKEALELIGGSGYGPGKVDGAWMICEKGEKMENPDIADQYNTVLKMACKRAKVDGCLSATACSDIFTQDIEDFSHETGEPIKKPGPAPSHPPQRKSTQPEPTAEELAAQAEKAKAAYHAAEGEKTPPAKPQTTPDGVKTAKGIVSSRGKPNAGGYIKYSLEGHQDDSGYDIGFATKDTDIIETLNTRLENRAMAGIEYTTTTNGKYTNFNIVGLVSVE